MTRFLDTNILLYSIDPTPEARDKRGIARALLDGGDCILSVQVLNEFLWQATKPVRHGCIDRAQAFVFVTSWRRHRIVPLDLDAFDAAQEIAEATNYGWWDCLIIAAAQISGASVLLTEDMQHGHVIDGVRIENPFRDLAR